MGRISQSLNSGSQIFLAGIATGLQVSPVGQNYAKLAQFNLNSWELVQNKKNKKPSGNTRTDTTVSPVLPTRFAWGFWSQKKFVAEKKLQCRL